MFCSVQCRINPPINDSKITFFQGLSNSLFESPCRKILIIVKVFVRSKINNHINSFTVTLLVIGLCKQRVVGKGSNSYGLVNICIVLVNIRMDVSYIINLDLAVNIFINLNMIYNTEFRHQLI